MIKTVIRLQNKMVFVFDKDGEQIPDYQKSVLGQSNLWRKCADKIQVKGLAFLLT